MLDDLDPRIEADAREATELAPDLWARIEADLDAPGPRDGLVSQSTPVRQGMATAALLLMGVVLIGAQGVREDLDTSGWVTFAVFGGWFLSVAVVGLLFVLRSRSARPVPGWPWAPAVWVVLLLGCALPWPGMTGVPASMHLYCFGATSAMVVVSVGWMLLLERSPRPIPWRVGLAAAASGLAAFAFQSVFCPGVDPLHLVVGHGGASVVWAVVGVAIAIALSFRQRV